MNEWFALFGGSPPLGLLAFEGLMVLYVLVSIPVVLALYAALRRSSPTLKALYLAVSLTGIVLFVVARPGFDMLALSQGYAAAPTDTQRAAYLAAGQSAVATFHGTAFWVSYALGSIGGLLVATAMLRSHAFGRPAAYARIASSVLDWGLFLPGVGLLISLGSVLCLLIFNVLVARRLLQLTARVSSSWKEVPMTITGNVPPPPPVDMSSVAPPAEAATRTPQMAAIDRDWARRCCPPTTARCPRSATCSGTWRMWQSAR